MIKSIANWLVEKRNPITLASIILMIVFASGISKIGFNGDFRHMFGEDNSDLMTLDTIESKFLQADNVVFLIKPANDKVFTKETLVLVQELTNKLWQTPYSIRVDSLTSYNKSSSADDTFTVEPLVEDANLLTEDDIRSIQQFAHQDAYLKKGLVSEAENVTAMVVTFALPTDPVNRLPAVTEAVHYLEGIQADLEKQNPGMEVHFMGGPSLEASMVSVVKEDLRFLIPLTIVVTFVTLGFILRSAVAVLGTILIIIVSNTLAMGIAGWLGFNLTPTSLMAPIMIMILAIADSVHLITSYIVYFRQGMSKIDAMKRSIETGFIAIILTSVTTMFGFISMNFNSSPAFQDFGNITVIGVTIALIYTFIFLPGLVLFFPMQPTQKPIEMTALMEKWARVVIKHPRTIVWINLIAVVITCSFIPRNELNDNIIEYFDDSTPLAKAVDFADKHLSGFQYIIFSLESKQEGGANDPAFMAKVDQFSEWLRAQESVVNVFSYIEIAKMLNKAMHNDDEAFKVIPESKELASQYMLLYEMSLPAGNDLTRDLDADRSSVRLMINLGTITNNRLIELNHQAQAWWEKNAPEYAYTGGGSRSLMFANIGSIIVQDQLGSSVFSFMAITLTIIIGLRSWKYGLISLVPNVFPAAMVYGAWGYFVGEVNQAAAITFSITLGLVVDDTIHFLSKYMKAREYGKTPDEAVFYCFSSTGTALFTTSAALVSGQLVLMFSSFVPNQTMAIMMSAIIVMALVLDFALLPAMLLLIDRKSEAKASAKIAIQSHLADFDVAAPLGAKGAAVMGMEKTKVGV